MWLQSNELNAQLMLCSCSIHFLTCYMPACVSRTCTYILRAPRIVRQYGETALMGAARWGRTDSVRLLLERGADVDVVDRVSAACVYLRGITSRKENKKKEISLIIKLDG